MSNEIKTIDELEALYYSRAGAEFIQKADAPVLSSTTGVYNAVYGALVWAQLNQEANVWGCLPKYVWNRSGWRVMTARAESAATGVAEAGTIPESIKPTFAQVSTIPKTIPTVFEVSEVQQFMAAESEDDAFGSVEQMRVLMGIHHKEMLNVSLLHDVSADAAGASAHRGPAEDSTNWYNFETLDRIVSNGVATTSEEAVFGGTYDAWFDVYNSDGTFNRDAGSTYDAYVDHNSGTDRDLTDDLVRSLLENVREAGGNPNLFITGHDTYSKLIGLYTTYVRYSPLGQSKASVTVNGISTAEGYPVGIDIPTLYGLPIIVSKNTTKDTISRIYCLDISDPEGFGVPRLGIQIAKPTQYFEAGMLSGNPFAINKFSNQGMYRTMGETICRKFDAQGKLRDLQ